MHSIEVKVATTAELVAANDLHNAHYGTNRSMSQFRWMFRGPEDEPENYLVILHEGRVKATQGLIPIQMTDRGSLFWSGKPEDTLVSSNLRVPGASLKLYKSLLQMARKRDIRLLWGFTTTAAVETFKRSGFVSPWSTEQLILPLRSTAIEAVLSHKQVSTNKHLLRVLGTGASLTSKFLRSSTLRMRRPTTDDLTLSAADTSPHDCDSYSLRFSHRWSTVTVHRSTRYLDWRISRNPFVKGSFIEARRAGQLVGLCVIAIDDQARGFVVDLTVAADDVEPGSPPTTLEREIVDRLLIAALTKLSEAGAHFVRMWGQGDHVFQQLVRRRSKRYGFLHLRRGGPSVLLSLDASEDDLCRAKMGVFSLINTAGASG